MKPLFEKKIGAYVLTRPYWVVSIPGMVASWPLARLQMYKDKLVITIMGKEYTLKYTEIDDLHKGLIFINIHHHAKSVPAYVKIAGSGAGIFLFKDIKDVIRVNKLPILIK